MPRIVSNTRRKHPEASTYRPLSKTTERPGPGTIVAIDTEFVALKQPEIEMNSEGEMETIRPMTHALARVSVVRSQGLDEGLPFIDDYIIIKEPVVDYLTLYSGITRGDLDPRTSVHTLVPLKQAFKKLWVLLILGCKFLGHGLKQDFRVINIQVPKAQIIDTIDLFFLKTRLRKLSLAFLAWCVLKENIQLETHDSIEDARTALKLYRKFLEYEDAGILETQLQEIYREGRETNFKPPKRDDAELLRRATDTPPVSAPALASTLSPLLAGSQPAPLSIQSVTAVAAASAETKPTIAAATAATAFATTSTPAPAATNTHASSTPPSQTDSHVEGSGSSSSSGPRHIHNNRTGPLGGSRGHAANGGSGRYHPPVFRGNQSNHHHASAGHDSHGGHSLPYRQYRRG